MDRKGSHRTHFKVFLIIVLICVILIGIVMLSRNDFFTGFYK